MAVPVAQIDIQKKYGTEFWTNRYLTDLAVGTAEVETLATNIATAERVLYPSSVIINKIRIASLTEGDNLFQTWDPNLPGTRSIGAAEMLPLFCVARIDFGAGLGRPSRKYIRASLTEADVSGANVSSGYITSPAGTYGASISGMAGIVDPQGSDLDGFSVSSAVGMRQLRRGTRRRTVPVL